MFFCLVHLCSNQVWALPPSVANAGTTIRRDYSLSIILKSEFTQAALSNAGTVIKAQYGQIRTKDAQISALLRDREKLTKASVAYARKTKDLQALSDAQEKQIKNLLDQLSQIDPAYRAALHAFENTIRGQVTFSEGLAAALENYRAGKEGAEESLKLALDADEMAMRVASDMKLRIASGYKRRLVAFEALDKVEAGTALTSTAISYFQSAVEHGDDVSIDSFAALAKLYVRIGSWKAAEESIEAMARVDRAASETHPLEVANLRIYLASFTEKPEKIEELLRINKAFAPTFKAGSGLENVDIIRLADTESPQPAILTQYDRRLFESNQQTRGQDFDVFVDGWEATNIALIDGVGFAGEKSARCLISKLKSMLIQSDFERVFANMTTQCATALAEDRKLTPKAPSLLWIEAFLAVFPSMIEDPCMQRNVIKNASDFPISICRPGPKLKAALVLARQRSADLRKVDPDDLTLLWQSNSLNHFMAVIEAGLGQFELARADMRTVLESREKIVATGATGTKPKRQLLNAYINAIEIEIAANMLGAADALDKEAGMIFGGGSALVHAELSDEVQRLFFLSKRVELAYKYANVSSSLPIFTTTYLELARRLILKLPNDKAVRWHEWDALASAYWVSHDIKLAKEFLSLCKSFEEAKESYFGWHDRCEANRPAMERAISEMR
jgi:hypothetical protein